MEMLREYLRWGHLAGGLTALVLFWIPALSTKGGRLHRVVGRWYVRGMWLVVATGVPLALLYFVRGQWFFGAFLSYLAVITGSGLWCGIAVLQHKASAEGFRVPAHAAIGIINAVAAIAVLALGLFGPIDRGARLLFIGFSVIGFVGAFGTWQFFRQPPADRRYWWYFHLGNMIGTGIAGHTAFAVFGVRRLFPEFDLGSWGLLPWFAPTVIGLGAIAWANAHYRRKFAVGA